MASVATRATTATTMANCSCGHQSNNYATSQPMVASYRVLGLSCGTVPKTATKRQPWSSATLRIFHEKRLSVTVQEWRCPFGLALNFNRICSPARCPTSAAMLNYIYMYSYIRIETEDLRACTLLPNSKSYNKAIQPTHLCADTKYSILWNFEERVPFLHMDLVNIYVPHNRLIGFRIWGLCRGAHAHTPRSAPRRNQLLEKLGRNRPDGARRRRIRRWGATAPLGIVCSRWCTRHVGVRHVVHR